MHDDHPTPARRPRLALCALAILATTTLSGCFDLLEEIWVSPDGSARMVLDVSLPKGLLQLAGQDPFTRMREEAKKTEAVLKEDPAVKRFAFRDFEEAGVHHLVYELEVNDASKLPELHRRAAAASNDTERVNALRFTFDRKPGGTLLFSQKLGKGAVAEERPDAGTPKNPLDDAAAALGKQMAQAMLAGHTVTVRIHAPQIGEANGTVNPDKDTVEWKIPVADLAAGSATTPELRAELDLGAPVWVWGLFIGIPALLLLLAIGAMKRRRGGPVVG